MSDQRITATEVHARQYVMTLAPGFDAPRFTYKTPPLCPDLLVYADLGSADHLRGRVVRAFFWLLRWWPT